jgi:hypothetical protein
MDGDDDIILACCEDEQRPPLLCGFLSLPEGEERPGTSMYLHVQ